MNNTSSLGYHAKWRGSVAVHRPRHEARQRGGYIAGFSANGLPPQFTASKELANLTAIPASTGHPSKFKRDGLSIFSLSVLTMPVAAQRKVKKKKKEGEF